MIAAAPEDGSEKRWKWVTARPQGIAMPSVHMLRGGTVSGLSYVMHEIPESIPRIDLIKLSALKLRPKDIAAQPAAVQLFLARSGPVPAGCRHHYGEEPLKNAASSLAVAASGSSGAS